MRESAHPLHPQAPRRRPGSILHTFSNEGGSLNNGGMDLWRVGLVVILLWLAGSGMLWGLTLDNTLRDRLERVALAYTETTNQKISTYSAGADLNKATETDAAPADPSASSASVGEPSLPPALPDIPFASLEMCRATHRKYYCVNDSACAGNICNHSNYGRNDMINLEPGKMLLKRYHERRAERLRALRGILADMEREMGPNDGYLMIIAFNGGYGYIFSNWYCSLVANKVDLDHVRRHTLVLATDDGARAIVKAAGFFAFDPTPLTDWTQMRVTTEAAVKFGFGAHPKLNLVTKFSMTADLLDLGVDVIVMDTDLIWAQNALPIMRGYCKRDECDAVFILDNRPFGTAYDAPTADKLGVPPSMFRADPRRERYPMFNTGFFMVRSSPATRQFAHVIVEGMPLQQWKSTDQLLWNSVMYHTAFKHMKWMLLPKARFVPGGALHRNRYAVRFPVQPPGTLVAVHVSDTAVHTDKIKRFIMIDHWYLAPEKCPAVFDTCKDVKGCLPRNFETLIANFTTYAAETHAKIAKLMQQKKPSELDEAPLTVPPEELLPRYIGPDRRRR